MCTPNLEYFHKQNKNYKQMVTYIVVLDMYIAHPFFVPFGIFSDKATQKSHKDCNFGENFLFKSTSIPLGLVCWIGLKF